MPTKWVVTTPVDHIELDEAQQGQTTFTVTNPTARVDRVFFDVVAGEGADSAWFTVDEPQRRVPANGSVSYLLKTSIPTTAKPGNYSVQGRAYSADSAPEEDSVLSSRLAVEVKAKAAPAAKKKFPWWIIVVAALVAIVLVVVGILVFGGGPASAPAEQVTVPDLAHQSQSQATTNLGAFGLTVGAVRHKFDPTPDQVIYQSVPGGSKAAKGTAVDLVVTATLAPPTLTAPAQGASIPASSLIPAPTPVPTNAPAPSGSATPTATATPSATPSAAPGLITWTDPDAFVTQWQVTILEQDCFVATCQYVRLRTDRVDAPSFSPILGPLSNHPGTVTQTGIYIVTVAAIDDFGNVGQQSGGVQFVVR